MEKWVVSSTVLLLLCLSGKTDVGNLSVTRGSQAEGSPEENPHDVKPVPDIPEPVHSTARDEDGFLSNLLLEEPVDEAQCDRMQLDVAALNSAMALDSLPRLQGRWLSQECEVRPGPEFLLRSYAFTKNNSFRLLQHFYEDESCILPLYTVTARGELTFKEPSWVTPSATECEYTLTRVTVIPHTTEMTEKLSNKIKHMCIDKVSKFWKPHREYVIYNSRSSDHYSVGVSRRRKHGRYQKKKYQREIDCLSAVGVEFNELMLIRSQWRTSEEGRKVRELLLGDIHSQREARFKHKPTAFQVPLLRSDQAHECVNCQLISKGTERAPPHLLSKPQLPPLPHGQWVSLRCEVRPFGMFLTRKLSFDTRDRTWTGEYRFHADPFCSESAFVISASGSYLIGPVQNKEMIRKKKTGTHFDFKVEDASLTLYDSTLRDTFNTETDCGVGLWQLGVPKELSPTSGCSILGIVLPTTEYELIKLEIDNKGTPLLFMGLPDTENKRRTHKDRPTSYQAPLAQCSAFPQQTVLNNHLAPIYYARTAPRSSAPRQPALFGLTAFVSLYCVSFSLSL